MKDSITLSFRDILSKNGSAVDATLAAMFCNGVVNMQSMGLGGGFIMTVYDRQEQKAYSLIARESAPGKATRDMFTNNTILSQDGLFFFLLSPITIDFLFIIVQYRRM